MNTPNQQKPKNLPHLTSLRFFAAITIVMLHFSENPIYDFNIRLLTIKGALSVDFFFILSGFIITHVYGESIKRKNFKFYDFLIKRFWKLYPLHFFTLIFYISLIPIFYITGMTPNSPQKYDISGIPAQILLIHAWGFSDKLHFNYPSWSISAEMFAYILFFTLFTGLRKTKSAWGNILLSISFFTTLWFISKEINTRPITRLTWDFGIIRILPEFIIGICAYNYFNNKKIYKNISLYFFTSIIVMITLIYTKSPDLLIVLSFVPVIFFAATLDRNGTKTPLSCRELEYLGKISYSLYMCHVPIYTVSMNLIDITLKKTDLLTEALSSSEARIFTVLFSILLCILASAGAYHFLELPGQRMFARVSARHDNQL